MKNISSGKKTAIIITMSIIGFLVILDTSIMNITLPKIQTAFNVSLNDLSWSINIYAILFASLLIPLGRLGDMFGRVKLLNIALLTFLIGSIVSGTSSNLTILLIGRTIQSIGAATMLPAAMLISLNIATKEERSKVVAILGVTQALGSAMGPAIGGIISQFFDWHWVFLINIPIVIILLMSTLSTLSMKNELTKSVKLDTIGTSLIVGTLLLMTSALVNGRDWGWTSFRTLGCGISSIVLFLLFIVCEVRTKDPIIPMNLFKNRDFVASIASILVAFITLASFIGILPTYLTKVTDVSQLKAAFLITPMSIALLISNPLSIALIGKIYNRILVGIGILASGAGIYMLSNLNVTNNWNQLYIIDIIIGFGIGFISGPALTVGIAELQGTELTAGQNVLNVMRNIGIIIGMAFFLSMLSGNITDAKHETYNYAVGQVNKIDLPHNSKTKIKNKLHDKLISGSNNNVNTSSKVESNTINDSKKNELINETYTKVVAQKQMALSMSLPPAAKAEIRQTVTNAVNKKVNKLNREIRHTTGHIKNHLHDKLTDSFLNLYAIEYPLVLASLIIVFIFKRMHA
ncbi:MFS transporter [Companilactobacillus zhachilii]|uniref:MFS transporter n=1 Tax=Companilactobacillus zhachilii TaxID=2304606 RepID=UPI001920D5A9|nr:MFS transporter [Companilactobacillus zhachilii]MBL3530282.1 MFS transporter [Companilactobacillus zhachilii]